MPTTLSASPNHRVVFHPHPDGPSERLIVTFAPKSDNFADEGFGTRVALRQGHDTIYVAQTRSAWHQALDHEELAALILPVAAGREIVAYGSSAGGYAAMYFGGALNARILAIAPRNDIHPLISVSEKLTRENFRHRPSLDDVPKSEHIPVLAFDPHQGKDSRLVYKWAAAAYPNAALHPVFGSGHNVVGLLHTKGILSPLAKGFFQGKAPESLQVWGEGTQFWHVSIAHDLRRSGDAGGALHHLQEARKLGTSMNVLMDIARIAAELGDAETAANATAELNAVKHQRRSSKAAIREKVAAREAS